LGDDHLRRVGFRDGVLCNSPAVFDDGTANADRAPSWLTLKVARGLPHEYRDMPRIWRMPTAVTAVLPSTGMASFL